MLLSYFKSSFICFPLPTVQIKLENSHSVPGIEETLGNSYCSTATNLRHALRASGLNPMSMLYSIKNISDSSSQFRRTLKYWDL